MPFNNSISFSEHRDIACTMSFGIILEYAFYAKKMSFHAYCIVKIKKNLYKKTNIWVM